MADQMTATRGRAAVVVLGDIGRSPRMQYHALSLARQAHLEVDIVANGGTDPHLAVLRHPSIHLHTMGQWPPISFNLPKTMHFLVLLVKPLFQFFMLLWVLLARVPTPDIFIVQNPPSVPALVAVNWASWFRGAVFIVDWHNFGYSLLGLSLGASSPFVAVYRWFENHYGKKAHASLCVTRAMQRELAKNWGIESCVLYDHPPEFFRTALLTEKHELFCRLGKSINQPLTVLDCINNESPRLSNNEVTETIITTKAGTDISLKRNRPALIVSSTSWTPDEDFQILLDAAVIYDECVSMDVNHELVWREPCGIDVANGESFLHPKLLFIITGKGPEKDKYVEKISRLHLKYVAFRTLWLSAEDYPLLLGSSDLGVCLHTSSSGMDLPMKVVDMFGCCLPVCAVSYPCIGELVKVGKNGLLFSSSSELADQLLMLFKGFPNNCDQLKALRTGAMETRSSGGWATEWEDHAFPIIDKFINKKLPCSSCW